MPDSLPKAPALIVRSLLADNWDATATAGLSPAKDPRTAAGLSLNRGWFNSVRYPLHVAIRSTSGEDTLGGGDSGYSGIDPSGAGPTQTKLGDLDVTIFAEGDAGYGTGTDTLDAEGIRDAIREEIEDIVMAAQSSPPIKTWGYDGNYGADYGGEDPYRRVPMPGAFESLSSSWDGNPNDTDVQPTVFIASLTVTYSWERWP